MVEELINHPSHYADHPSGIEAIQICRYMNFNLGNVIKYVMRAGRKKGASNLDDLRKAVWYLKNEIALLDPDGPEAKELAGQGKNK